MAIERDLIQRSFVISIAFLLTAALGLGQPWGALTNDHPIVIDHLIHIHDSLAAQVAASNAADPSHAESRQSGLAAVFGVSASGYQPLARILAAAKTNLDKVRIAQTTYVNGLTNKTPTSAASVALAGYEQQQLTILHSVPVDLKAQLGPADWGGLQSFIAKELVAKIQVGMATKPVSPPIPVPPPGTNTPNH